MSDKKHYYLASTRVLFRKRVSEHERALNVLLILDNNYVRQHDMGHVQQSAQVRLFQLLGENEIKDISVYDVFIESISYLGHMTKDEFTATPESEAKKLLEDTLASSEDRSTEPEVNPEGIPSPEPRNEQGNDPSDPEPA